MFTPLPVDDWIAINAVALLLAILSPLLNTGAKTEPFRVFAKSLLIAAGAWFVVIGVGTFF